MVILLPASYVIDAPAEWRHDGVAMAEIDDLAAFAVDVVQRAGHRIAALRAAGTIEERTKDDGRELVTAADQASHDLIVAALAERMPRARVLSEEGASHEVGSFTGPSWIADPLDGTVNFLYGHAHVGVSLAYAVDGVVQLGVVHAPFTSETYVAVRDRGATLDGSPLRPAKARPLDRALVATGFPHRREGMDAILARFGRVVSACRDVRRLASPALDICWVAAGRLDAAFETLRPWDVAAAGLVAREAGVGRAHYSRAGEEWPADLRGDDVAFAHEDLLPALLACCRAS